jgi:hypothetical protein
LTFGRVLLFCVVLQSSFWSSAIAQTAQTQFGGKYSDLDERRQRLVDDWVARLAKTSGQSIAPAQLYDDVLGLSTKTTFVAVTHALMTTRLTDQAGADLGDALALVERIDASRGEITGERGDHQFRVYVRLTADAFDKLSRSQQFKRGADNTIYHKGYPINYRGQGGTPSMQISIALDRRNADIDVDYRASSFPAALFNGHLTASNSDVRAGNNYDRHLNRWTGFQNWWQGFFGVRTERVPGGPGDKSALSLSAVPRTGKKDVEVMAGDFLKAWLVEGNAIAAMGYVSERAYACLAQDLDDPLKFDRGMAPFQLLINLKVAYDTLGTHDSLQGLVVGTRLTRPGVRVVEQPQHAQFVVYSMPDDIAATLDCESRLRPGEPASAKRIYGNYFATTFYVAGRSDEPVALLWAKDNGYWKIVSWRVGAADAEPAPPAIETPAVPRIPVDRTLAAAARGFLESWLVKKQYDAAFAYLSPQSYSCYDLERDSAIPASTSAEDAGRKIRAALASSSAEIGTGRKLDQVIEAVEPFHAAVRVMDHPDAKVFSLTSLPDALADAAECSARAGDIVVPDPMPLVYGNGFGTNVRFKTRAGDAPILRLLWRKEAGTWRITTYGVELP